MTSVVQRPKQVLAGRFPLLLPQGVTTINFMCLQTNQPIANAPAFEGILDSPFYAPTDFSVGPSANPTNYEFAFSNIDGVVSNNQTATSKPWNSTVTFWYLQTGGGGPGPSGATCWAFDASQDIQVVGIQFAVAQQGGSSTIGNGGSIVTQMNGATVTAPAQDGLTPWVGWGPSSFQTWYNVGSGQAVAGNPLTFNAGQGGYFVAVYSGPAINPLACAQLVTYLSSITAPAPVKLTWAAYNAYALELFNCLSEGQITQAQFNTANQGLIYLGHPILHVPGTGGSQSGG